MMDWFFDPRLAGCRRVFIRDFDVSAAIGVFPQEQGRRQAVRINIDFWVPVAVSPSQRDKLVDVVDYDFVRPGIQRLIDEGHIGLLETLVDKTIEQVLLHPKVVAVRVRAEKSEVYPDCESAGVEVFRFKPQRVQADADSCGAAAHWVDPERSPVPIRNIFCIGRNYAAHIAELGNRPADDPVVFSKPTSAVLQSGQDIPLPAHSQNVHFETELVLLIGRGGRQIKEADALSHVSGYAVGLDLTARDVQTRAKAQGLPWELGKGFDGSACLSSFRPMLPDVALDNMEFTLNLNGQLRQHGKVANMLYPVPFIIAYLSQVFTLQPGDIIYTGTPEGVGPLNPGDDLILGLNGETAARFRVSP